MKNKNSKKQIKNDETRLSWKELLRFYTKIKMPWVLILIMGIASFTVKKAENLLVPYTSKIMTGAITEHGFLFGFVLMSILSIAITESQGSLTEWAGASTAKNIQHKIWGKLIHLPMSFYHKHEPQSLVSRVTQDTNGAFAAVSSIVQLFAVLYGVYTNFISMYRGYKSLALIMLTGIPISFLATFIVGKLQYKYDNINNNSLARITNFFAERLPNILHIKTSSMEDKEYQKGVAENDLRFKEEMRAKRRFIFIGPIGSFAQYVNEIVLLVVASAMVRAGTMQMYHLVSMYNYYLLFMGNAFMITGIWQSVKSSHGACATIAKIVNEPEEDLEVGESVPGVKNITFQNVSFGYTEEKKVLDNISFTIPEGKVTAIVGENGCGKSTIIKLLERFDEPNSGAILFGEKRLSDMKLAEWRDQIGYLFQGEQIIKGSIRENLTYGSDREYTDEELIEAAKLAHAYEFIKEKEEGFDTQISRFDTKLSGGEQQRLAIARIILKKPRYLIMDEATSGIDAVSEAEVLEGVRNMMTGKTVIMVSHDMKLISKADHIIVLNDGKIEDSGDFDTVSKSSDLFRLFLATQSV